MDATDECILESMAKDWEACSCDAGRSIISSADICDCAATMSFERP